MRQTLEYFFLNVFGYIGKYIDNPKKEKEKMYYSKRLLLSFCLRPVIEADAEGLGTIISTPHTHNTHHCLLNFDNFLTIFCDFLTTF
jgi:hypothetical protein